MDPGEYDKPTASPRDGYSLNSNSAWTEHSRDQANITPIAYVSPFQRHKLGQYIHKGAFANEKVFGFFSPINLGINKN